MVENNFNTGTPNPGRKLPVREHYKSLVEILNTLLDLGVIELPKLSDQWRGHINASLNGDTFPLEQAMERWEKVIDPILKLHSDNPILEKWKTKEFDYIFRVHKILNFYMLVTKLSFGE